MPYPYGGLGREEGAIQAECPGRALEPEPPLIFGVRFPLILGVGSWTRAGSFPARLDGLMINSRYGSSGGISKSDLVVGIPIEIPRTSALNDMISLAHIFHFPLSLFSPNRARKAILGPPGPEKASGSPSSGAWARRVRIVDPKEEVFLGRRGSAARLEAFGDEGRRCG